MSLTVKKILSKLASSLSAPLPAETKSLVHLNFDYNLQLINSILSDFQKLFQYFNGTAIVEFLNNPFAPSDSVPPNNLALYMKDVKLLVFGILLFNLVGSSSE